MEILIWLRNQPRLIKWWCEKQYIWWSRISFFFILCMMPTFILFGSKLAKRPCMTQIIAVKFWTPNLFAKAYIQYKKKIDSMNFQSYCNRIAFKFLLENAYIFISRNSSLNSSLSGLESHLNSQSLFWLLLPRQAGPSKVRATFLMCDDLPDNWNHLLNWQLNLFSTVHDPSLSAALMNDLNNKTSEWTYC